MGLLSVFVMLLGCFRAGGLPAQQPTQATTVPLLLPGGLAYDSAGNLYFAEIAHHVVRRVSPAGVLTTVAGSGVQGFGGDGGPAVNALLDSPAAVAFDRDDNLYIADTHNHRVRRVSVGSGSIATVVGTGLTGLPGDGTLASSAAIDSPVALALDGAGDLYLADERTNVVLRVDHSSGLIRRVAGNGVQGSSGDGGPAIAAATDTPSGLALDAAGNLYLADAHNHRVRRVDAQTGVITSVAGTGQPGFGGDGGAAGQAVLRLPRGLALDADGDLFVVDASNHRIRRIDAKTGMVATVAGDGTQAYAGDEDPANAASLDNPRSVTVAAGSALPAIGDSGNERVREVDAGGIIHTVAGLGATIGGALTLSGPSVAQYGMGTVTATLSASPATGAITFFEHGENASTTLATVALTTNAANFSTGRLPVGTHRISATYGGDAGHAAAQSGTVTLEIAAAPLTVDLIPIDLVYGQAIPTLNGSLSGILPQDNGQVTLRLTTSAVAFSTPGTYPIVASLLGTAAGNYKVAAVAQAVSIAKAPSGVALTNALTVQVTPGTAGTPTGAVTLQDGANVYAVANISASGSAAFSAANLSTGSHTLVATYGGDTNFLPAASAPLVMTIGAGAAPDFALAATGTATVTVAAGGAAAFSFSVQPVNGSLASEILLTASGLPSGASASFNPAYLPPPNGPAAFILTVQTPKTASVRVPHGLIFATCIPILLLAGRRRRNAVAAALLGLCLGCGDRVNTAQIAAATRTYNITVIATATASNGSTLQHTAVVTLAVQ